MECIYLVVLTNPTTDEISLLILTLTELKARHVNLLDKDLCLNTQLLYRSSASHSCPAPSSPLP